MIELLRFSKRNGCGQVRQTLVEPVVYLDTWAIREFAENTILGERFRAALLFCHGTLALSDINLIEFTAFESPRHMDAAGRLVDSLLPHLFLMRGDPGKVIAREEELLAGRLDQSPAADETALAQFAEAAVRRGGRFSMAAWFNITHAERGFLKRQLAVIAKVFYSQLRQLRERQPQDPRSLEPIVHVSDIARGRPATEQLMRAIVRDLRADRRLTENPNSAVDLLHAIVPGAYCDFVLLDRQWSDRLARAATRLKEASIPLRLRTTYSKQNQGIDRFLQTLEGWPAPR